MTDYIENDDDIWEDGDPSMSDTCPNCGAEYDEIDYEFQICHICKHTNQSF